MISLSLFLSLSEIQPCRTKQGKDAFAKIIKASKADAQRYFSAQVKQDGSYDVDFTWEGKTYQVKVRPDFTVRRLKESIVNIIRESDVVSERTKAKVFPETIRVAFHGVVIAGNKDGDFTTLQEIEGFDEDVVLGVTFMRNYWALGNRDNASHKLINGDGKLKIRLFSREVGTLEKVYEDDDLISIVTRIASETAVASSAWRLSYWTGISDGGDGISYGSLLFDFNDKTLAHYIGKKAIHIKIGRLDLYRQRETPLEEARNATLDRNTVCKQLFGNFINRMQAYNFPVSDNKRLRKDDGMPSSSKTHNAKHST